MIVCIAIYNSLHCHIQFPIIYHTHTQKKKGISFVFNLSFSVSKKRREPIWKKIIGWDIETRSWFSSKTFFFFFFSILCIKSFFVFLFFFFAARRKEGTGGTPLSRQLTTPLGKLWDKVMNTTCWLLYQVIGVGSGKVK